MRRGEAVGGVVHARGARTTVVRFAGSPLHSSRRGPSFSRFAGLFISSSTLESAAFASAMSVNAIFNAMAAGAGGPAAAPSDFGERPSERRAACGAAERCGVPAGC